MWLSALKVTASPSPRSSTPAFSPGPCSTRAPLARQPLQEQRRVLVAAVLRPEEREDGELEVVRLALQQLLDTGVLPVREAELAVEWLFRDGAQEASLADGLLTALADQGRCGSPHIRATPVRLPSTSRESPRRPPPAAPLRDLGLVVPLHQARRRRARAVGGRARTPRLRRAVPARCCSRAAAAWHRCAATSSRSSCSGRSTTRSRSGCSASPRRASTPG